MQIGENLKRIRKERELSQKGLGECLGFSQQQISEYESEKKNPKLETVEKIAKVLEVSVAELAGESYIPPADLPEDVQKLLNRYQELYDEWQNSIKEEFSEEPLKLSDECLLIIALDEAIAYMHLKLADSRKGVK